MLLPTKALLLEIANCPIAKAHLGDPSYLSPCRKIVLTQTNRESHLFQCPEPWSGHIDESKLLFISSNPSIDEEEDYPNFGWTDDAVVDFFANRFGVEGKWVKDYRYPRLRSGQYRKKAVHYWGSLRNRAKELFERDTTPDSHYAMTEIVHCKSRGEAGVVEALSQCGGRYFERTLSAAAKARVVVIVGKKALEFYTTLALPGLPPLSRDARFGRRTRTSGEYQYFVWLPHPVAREPKTFAKTFSNEEIAKLRAALSENDS